MFRPILFAAGLVLVSGSPAWAHRGTTNDASWQVCADAVLGDTCEFVGHHQNLHRGTCRSFSGTLGCVRNKPLIKQSAVQRSGLSFPALMVTGAGGLFAGLFVVARKNVLFPWRN